MMSTVWETVFTTLTQPAAALVMATLLSVVLVLNWYQGRKMRKLERHLMHQQQLFRQELTMVNQGAMGVGSRVKHLEQKLKGQPNAFEKVLAKAARAEALKPESKATKPQGVERANTTDLPKVAKVPKATSSRAEQALDRWMRESRHIA